MWTPTDALKLRDYLNKNSGNLIQHLTEIAPTILIGADSNVEGVAIQGAFKEGYMTAIQRMKELSIIPNKMDDASSSGYVAM